MRNKKQRNILAIGIAAVVILLVSAGVVLFYSDSSLLTGAIAIRRGAGARPPRDNARPTVELISPESQATVNGTTEISVNATDNVGITRIDFFIDNYFVGTDENAPFLYNWDTTAASNSTHAIRVHAYDAARNSASVSSAVTVLNEAGVMESSPEPVLPTIELGDRLSAQGVLANNNVPLLDFYVRAPIDQDASLGYVRLEYSEVGTPDLNVGGLVLYDKDGERFNDRSYEIRDARRTQNYKSRVNVANATVSMLIDFANRPIRAGERVYFELRANSVRGIDAMVRQCVTVSLENFPNNARSVCNDVPSLQIGPESREPETTYTEAGTKQNIFLYDFTASAPWNIDARVRRIVLPMNKTAGVWFDDIRLLSGPRYFQYTATVTDNEDAIVFELDEPQVIATGESRDYTVWSTVEGNVGDSLSLELPNQPESRRTIIWR